MTSKLDGNLSYVLAFAGNSFLTPVNLMDADVLTREFWEGFPRLQSGGVGAVNAAIDECQNYIVEQLKCEGHNALQERLATEYAAFIGPPKPRVAPWETFYKEPHTGVGFGQATFAMKEELRRFGLEVSSDNNQYADHIGIELLLAAKLAMDASGVDALVDVSQDECKKIDSIKRYVSKFPATWISDFCAAIEASGISVYYQKLANLASVTLEHI
jgi:TorA maturation chaperone TorD